MEAENKNKPFSSMRRDAQAAAHSLAGLPLIYPSGGGTVFVCFGGGAWHARNVLSSPQEINLFERAAGLKIGTPQNNSIGINCPEFARRRGDSREAKLAKPFPHVCYGNVSLVGLSVVLFSRPFSGVLTAVRRDRASISLLATCHAVPPAATFDRM